MAPWSSRREMAGLMGTFLVFLLSYPGHSDLLVNQTRHLFQQLTRLMLVFLGLVTPVAPTAPLQQVIARIHKTIPTVTSPSVSPIVHKDMNFVPMNMIQRHWTYIFEGKATLHDQPCPNASVLVRLMSGDDTVTKGTITGADGSYSMRIAIDADEKEPVDWEINAYTPDFKRVEIAGRRITEPQDNTSIAPDQTPIVVNNPVEFMVSLSR